MKTKDRVVQLYRQGLGGPTIAKRLGLHPGTVYYHLRDLKKPNGGRQAKTNGDEIKKLYEDERLSCQQIADKLGLSSSSVVYNRLKNMGVKLRSKSEGMRERGITKRGPDLEIIDLYKQGIAQKDIARLYNLSTGDTIRGVLNHYNVNESNLGSRNPAWRGGITTIANTIRSSSQYLSFRKKFFDDSDYKSRVSLIHSHELNLHHIVPFGFILNNFTDLENWQDCPYLWDQNNVIVLTKEEHNAIHANEKLSIDFTRFSVRKINSKDVVLLLAANHYIGTLPRSSRYVYGLFIDNALVGCCTIGPGSNRFLSSGAGGPALELTRLCLVDWLPKNTGSYFLSRCIKLFRQDSPEIEYLVAFADPNVGHHGGIYRASNWKYTGQGKKDYMYKTSNGVIKHKSKFRCKDGKTERELASAAGAIKVRVEGKHRYIYSVFSK